MIQQISKGGDKDFKLDYYPQNKLGFVLLDSLYYNETNQLKFVSLYTNTWSELGYDFYVLTLDELKEYLEDAPKSVVFNFEFTDSGRLKVNQDVARYTAPEDVLSTIEKVRIRVTAPKSIYHLLGDLVKNDCYFLSNEYIESADNESGICNFNALKISNSTLTVYMPYVNVDTWKSHKILETGDFSVKSNDFYMGIPKGKVSYFQQYGLEEVGKTTDIFGTECEVFKYTPKNEISVNMIPQVLGSKIPLTLLSKYCDIAEQYKTMIRVRESCIKLLAPQIEGDKVIKSADTRSRRNSTNSKVEFIVEEKALGYRQIEIIIGKVAEAIKNKKEPLTDKELFELMGTNRYDNMSVLAYREASDVLKNILGVSSNIIIDERNTISSYKYVLTLTELFLYIFREMITHISPAILDRTLSKVYSNIANPSIAISTANICQ